MQKCTRCSHKRLSSTNLQILIYIPDLSNLMPIWPNLWPNLTPLIVSCTQSRRLPLVADICRVSTVQRGVHGFHLPHSLTTDWFPLLNVTPTVSTIHSRLAGFHCRTLHQEFSSLLRTAILVIDTWFTQTDCESSTRYLLYTDVILVIDTFLDKR